MKTDAVIKSLGFRILFEKMDAVEAERFIMLLKRERFDYTQWRQSLWEDMTVEELSQNAMKYLKSKS
jgi:hypothetical protein